MRNLVCAMVVVAVGSGGGSNPPPFQKARAEAALNGYFSGQKRTGMAAAVVRRDRRLWSGALGLADRAAGTKVTPDTPFLTASISKTFATVAVMRLVEQRKARLDDDIDAYLPFPVRNPARPASPITLRQLLSHTSGLVDDHLAALELYTVGADDPTPLGDLIRAFFVDGGRYASPDNFAPSAPGTAYAYSNLGFALVGYLVERISGEPFDAYTERTILKPLGMVNSHWRLARYPAGKVATPYNEDGTSIGQYGFPDYPNGGLRSTANDLANFLRMMIQGGSFGGRRLLRRASVAEMLRVQYPSVEGAESQGLGWQAFPSGGSVVWGHAGGEKGAGAFIGLDLKTACGAVFIENMTIDGHEEQYRSVVGELLAAAQ